MTPPIESRRRRAASLAVLSLAAVASLGTSPSPQPPPALSEATTGTILVTAESPVATVDVSVTANAALRSAPTNSTEIRIGAANISGPGPVKATTLVTVEALDGAPDARTDLFPTLGTYLDEACGVGACTRRFRVTVVLTDPEADRATFDWAASANSRFGAGGGTGSPPPGSRLEVTAEQVVLVPADRLSLTTVTPDSVRLDGAHPRTVVTYELTRPPDGPTAGASPRLLLRLEETDGAPGTVMVAVGDAIVGSTRLFGPSQLVPFSLPATCENPEGCTEPLTITWEWDGGIGSETVEQGWSLTGVTTAPPDARPVPFTFGEGSTTRSSLDDPHPTATTSGSFDIGRDRFTFIDATVILHPNVADQGQGKLRGVIQGTLTATSSGVGGTAETKVGIVIDERRVEAAPGEPLVAVSRLMPIDCARRCAIDFGFGATMNRTDPIDTHVEWTLTVVFLADAPDSAPSDVELLLETRPRPSP